MIGAGMPRPVEVQKVIDSAFGLGCEAMGDEIGTATCTAGLETQNDKHTTGMTPAQRDMFTKLPYALAVFEQTLEAGGEPKRVCNLLTQVGLKLAHERGGDLSGLRVDPVAVADLAKMADAGTVSATAAGTILQAKMVGILVAR